MVTVNKNYLKLPGSYLFSTVAKKEREYRAANPDKKVIKLSIGDVTQPIAPSIIEATKEGRIIRFEACTMDPGFAAYRCGGGDGDVPVAAGGRFAPGMAGCGQPEGFSAAEKLHGAGRAADWRCARPGCAGAGDGDGIAGGGFFAGAAIAPDGISVDHSGVADSGIFAV